MRSERRLPRPSEPRGPPPGGRRGVARAVQILADEAARTMRLLGVTSVGELGRRTYVLRSYSLGSGNQLAVRGVCSDRDDLTPGVGMATVDAPALLDTSGLAPLPYRHMSEITPVLVRRLPALRPVERPDEGPAAGSERAEAAPDEPASATAAPDAARRDPRLEVGTVLRLVLEVLDGRRPPSQLGRRLDPAVLRYLAAARNRLNPTSTRRVAVPRRDRHGPPGLSSLRLCRPADGVAEASAVWRYQGRHRALAARFEWTSGRWRCTALRLG